MRLVASLLAIASGCAAAPDYDHAAEINVLGGKADSNVARKKWSFLLYGAADNNLASYILDDLNELESVGSTADVNFLAFLDTPQGASVNYLLADGDRAALHSPTASWGAVDSGDVNTLIDFVEWGLESYPAERYAVIVSGHGGGSPRVIAPDDSTGNAIAAQSLESALHVITYDTHYKIQLFGADACLMQTIELAYQLRYQANQIVASENTEPGTGWHYETIGSMLANEPDMWGRDLSTIMVGSYAGQYARTGQGATLAALDTDEFLRPPSDGTFNVANQLDMLTKLLVPYAATAAGRAELQDYASRVYRVYGSSDEFADLVDLLTLMESSPSAALRTQAASTRKAVQDYLVIVAWSDPLIARRPGGVSVYFPTTATDPEITEYTAHYAFARELGWGALLRAVHGL